MVMFILRIVLLVTPEEFAKVLIRHGVTTVISDPHEIANVSGVKGIEYMLEQSEDLLIDVFVMLPSVFLPLILRLLGQN